MSTLPHRVNALFDALPANVAGRKLVDMGSGDGRICIAAAARGMHAVGFEINPWLVLMSRVNAYRAGVSRTAFTMDDMWGANLADFDVIVIYGVTQIMDRLRAKIEAEAVAGTIVCCNHFGVRAWKPCMVIENDFWIYRVERDSNGAFIRNSPTATSELVRLPDFNDVPARGPAPSAPVTSVHQR